MSTEHNKSELETSVSMQKHLSLFTLTLSWSCSKYVVLFVFNTNWQALMYNSPFFLKNMSVMPTEHLLFIIAMRK